jgi:hypothetical protein
MLPTRRAADILQRIVHRPDDGSSRLRRAGQDMISRMLARAGWDISPRSAGRYMKASRIADTTPPRPPTPTPKRGGPVIARFFHHTWMMGVSVVKQLLGPDLHMAAVSDAFSRVPVALEVFDHKPNARDQCKQRQLT